MLLLVQLVLVLLVLLVLVLLLLACVVNFLFDVLPFCFQACLKKKWTPANRLGQKLCLTYDVKFMK